MLAKAAMVWCLCSCLPAIATGAQAVAQSQEKGLIEGIAVEAATATPVRKAHVTLEAANSRHDSELVATTDATGHFRFADVDAGSYRLTVDKAGFLPGGYGVEKPEDANTLLNIKAGERLHDVTLRLFPAGSISGHVLDADGDPAAGYEVILWGRDGRGAKARYRRAEDTTTNRTGEYRFEGLRAGTYMVSAGRQLFGVSEREIAVDSEGKKMKQLELWTFYPGTLSFRDAQTLRIGGGQEQTGIDIQIERAALLTVKGRIAGSAELSAKYRVSASVEEGLGFTSDTAKVLPNGEFSIELPPGKHELILWEPTANGEKAAGRTEVDLADQDVTGVVIAPQKLAQATVRVVMEGEESKPLTSGSVFLVPRGSEESSRNNFIQYIQYQPQNGVYRIEAIPAGQYFVHFNNASGCYLKSVLSAGRTIDGAVVDVQAGATLDLLLTYSKKVASVAGQVGIEKDQPRRGIFVRLVPENPAWHWLGVVDAELDQNSRFSRENVRPGKYLVFASQEEDTDAWSNPEFVKLVAAAGSEVELKENGHAEISLKLIPKDVTDRARQQLGL